jgi:hypothetical protein
VEKESLTAQLAQAGGAAKSTQAAQSQAASLATELEAAQDAIKTVRELRTLQASARSGTVGD